MQRETNIEDCLDISLSLVTPMESSGVMEGSKKQPEGLVRDDADHSNIGGLRDYLHRPLPEGQEHGFETSQQAVKLA